MNHDHLYALMCVYMDFGGEEDRIGQYLYWLMHNDFITLATHKLTGFRVTSSGDKVIQAALQLGNNLT